MTDLSGVILELSFQGFVPICAGLPQNLANHPVSKLSMECCLKALVWALLLLVLIIYVFGIAMTQACLDFRIDNPGHPESTGVLRDYWGDLGASMYTLFKCIAGGLSWDVVIHEMHNTVGFAWVAVFTFYIAFTYFAVLNVVTGPGRGRENKIDRDRSVYIYIYTHIYLCRDIESQREI